MKMTTRSLVSGVALGGATLAMAFGSVDRAQAASIFTGNSGNTGVGTYTVNNGESTAITNNGAWFQNDPTSFWIGSQSAAPGKYTYETTFNLSDFQVGTAQISGSWAMDDSAVSILLNGFDTDITYAPGTGFGGLTTFSIGNSAEFQDGINTLAFTINNGTLGGNNPSGLNVAMTGTFDPSTTAVPEPSDFVGTVFALGSVVALKRKFGKK
jgi:hypothetical protein